LQGEQFDLQELKEILLGHDPSIIQDGGSFYLRSKKWDQLNDAGEIHNRAKEFIQALENAAYLHFRDTAPLTIGGVIKIDDDGASIISCLPKWGLCHLLELGLRQLSWGRITRRLRLNRNTN